MNSPQDIARFQARMQTYRNRLQQYKTHLLEKVPTSIPTLKRSVSNFNSIADIDALSDIDGSSDYSSGSFKKIRSTNDMCVTIYPFQTYPKIEEDKIMGSKSTTSMPFDSFLNSQTFWQNVIEIHKVKNSLINLSY